MTHKSLFDAPAMAPPTSGPVETKREASRKLDSQIDKLQRVVLSYVKGAGKAGRTDEEIQVGLGMRPDTARARRCELRDAGLVVDSGRTRKTSSGRAAVIWVAAGDDRRAAPTSSERPPATAKECWWCHRRKWWRSIYGVVVCGNCHPPASEEVVAEWL